MHEVTGPVIAIVLTLCAVFVPVAFLGGLTGELYRQFAVTISIAVVISGLVALTLTPALCALILKPARARRAGFFAAFNRWFARVTAPLRGGVALDDPPRRASASLLFAGMVAVAVGLWRITPGSLVPDEDQGYYIAAVILPDGATLERTDKVVDEVEDAIQSNPADADVDRVHRLRLPRRRLRNNAATLFVTQKPWDERKVTGAAAGRRALRQDRPASRRRWCSRSIRRRSSGSGTAGGFEFYLQNRGEGGAEAPGRGDAAVPRSASTRIRSWARADAVARRTCRSSTSTSTARRRRRSACRSTTSSARCRRRSAPLRQRLQQVRPHLAGADAGRAAVPQASRRHRRGLRALATRAR